MSNLVLRSLSGIIYVAVIAASILLGWSFFMGLTALLAVLGILEFNRVAAPSNSLLAYFIDGMGSILIVLSSSAIIPSDEAWSYFFILMILTCFVMRLVLTIFDYSPEAFTNLSRSVFGVLYVSVPLAVLNWIYAIDYDFKWVILAMFIFIWLNDTGAFCFGSIFGKHKLCERLSPKKSWEGFWGGFVCCLAFGVAAYYIFGILPLVAWIILGALISLFATWGDLLESLIKRSMKVKDSGKLIPGHGGILDRIDSLLLVAPVTFMFIVLLFAI